MNWKSTTLVWGAGLIATWYAAVPPTQSPVNAPAEAPEAPGVAEAAADIAYEASRLQGQLRRQADYVPPVRNPFRFNERPRPEEAPVVREPSSGSSEPPPVMILAGIAADRRGDDIERTAILSTSAGVQLVRVGDEVLGRYRVTRIDDAGVEFVTLSGGDTLRLAFTP